MARTSTAASLDAYGITNLGYSYYLTSNSNISASRVRPRLQWRSGRGTVVHEDWSLAAL